MKRFFQGFLLLMIFGFGFVMGMSQQSAAQVDSDFALLRQAVDFVNQNFVKPQPDSGALEYALIRAYLAELGDRNTYFIEPAVAATETQVLAGRYGGIGVEIQRNEAGEYILFPFAESSALAAGVRDGDILLAINGQALEFTMTMDQVRQSLRGEIKDGAGVDLRLRNREEVAEREFFVPFAEVLVPSLTWRTLYEAPEIGYLSISRFTVRTPDEFAQAIFDLKSTGIKALVLDLRNNPGGLLAESLRIADEFLDGGVLSIERRVTGESFKEGQSGGLVTDLPLVILVNRGTASASEIVAGAIQARGRGILIGQPTFGKGSIQSIFALEDQSSIHVTVALWYTPDYAELDEVGLSPDIELAPDENGRDIELGEAIRHLQAELAEE